NRRAASRRTRPRHPERHQRRDGGQLSRDPASARRPVREIPHTARARGACRGMSSDWAAIRFSVNGEGREVRVPPMKRLLDVLREDLHLTGSKEGCGEGECGSCTVRMNGELVNSCLVPVLQAAGANVQTVEGLACDGEMHPLQRAFLECGG